MEIFVGILLHISPYLQETMKLLVILSKFPPQFPSNLEEVETILVTVLHILHVRRSGLIFGSCFTDFTYISRNGDIFKCCYTIFFLFIKGAPLKRNNDYYIIFHI